MRIAALAAVLLAALVSGCGGDAPAPEVAAATSTTSAPVNDFTSAVPVGGIAASAKLAFQLGAAPVLGQPVTVRFRVTPTATVQKIQVVFETEAGLSFVDELRATVLVDATNGKPSLPYELQVLPAKDGLLLLKASVMTETDGTSKVTEFAIPLLVSGSQPAAGAVPAR